MTLRHLVQVVLSEASTFCRSIFPCGIVCQEGSLICQVEYSADDQIPDGVFLVRVQRVQFRRQAPKPYYALLMAVLQPSRFAGCTLSSRLHCNPKALWNLNWFLRDFCHHTELLGRDEVEETQVVGLNGVVKISHIVLNGTPLLRWMALLLLGVGKNSPPKPRQPTGGLITYSYTQISQYLCCPRRYRHRYLDGWKEKDTRAAMLFGRAFERALGALFRRQDPGAVLFGEWSACQGDGLHYSNRDSWDRMLQQGILLLTAYPRHRKTLRQAVPNRVEDSSSRYQKNRRACYLWTRSLLATRGTVLWKSRRSFSYARAWWRFCTCARPSATSNARSLAG